MTEPTIPLVLVAAVARNRAIGRDNQLLWRLKSDMAHFRACTMGKPVLMGRKTWDSIGRPLPGRAVIVITRNPRFVAAGVDVVTSVEAGLALAEIKALEMRSPDIVVAGGAEIYAALLPQAHMLRLTEVELAPQADAFFPAFDRSQWREVRRDALPASIGDEAPFAFVDYLRTSDT